MDNYSMWQDHQREQDRKLASCPVCCYCGHPIQDENLFDINGELYHIKCAEDEFRKMTEDYET
jgi:hypothetical protein